MESCKIEMVDLFEQLTSCSEGLVYRDDKFVRRRWEVTGREGLSVTADRLSDYGATCFYISFECAFDGRISLEFVDSRVLSRSEGLQITDVGRNRLYWLAQSGSFRSYDSHKRITESVEVLFEVHDGDGAVVLSVDARSGYRFELSVVVFDEAESYASELAEFDSVETMKVVRGTWFVYENICDAWKHLINGVVWSLESHGDIGGWPGEHVAYVLYHYLSFLENRTGKRIYSFERDLVAYSLMLTLPSEGRWRHGICTDTMETHTVFQVCGIDVLMSHYERTSQDVFLAKAREGADYLVTVVDEMNDGGIWFLHDTLEMSVETVGLYYKPLVESEAFGKSVPNTLTLNSHVWTLILLKRFYELTGDQRYLRFFDRGMASLGVVLEARPAAFLYRIVYRIQDMIVKSLSRKHRKQVVNLRGRYESMLRGIILPAMKRRFPRLVMPNGFVERDLCYSHWSNFYNALNMKVLLILYGQTGCEQLVETISSGANYCLASGIIEYTTQYGSRPAQFIEILFMYAALIDEKMLSSVSKYLRFFREREVALQVDAYASPLVAGVDLSIRVDNENIVVLTSAYEKFFIAVLFNCADDEQEVVVDGAEGFDIVECSGERRECGKPIRIDGGGYVTIVRSSGE